MKGKVSQSRAHYNRCLGDQMALNAFEKAVGGMNLMTWTSSSFSLVDSIGLRWSFVSMILHPRLHAAAIVSLRLGVKHLHPYPVPPRMCPCRILHSRTLSLQKPELRSLRIRQWTRVGVDEEH